MTDERIAEIRRYIADKIGYIDAELDGVRKRIAEMHEPTFEILDLTREENLLERGIITYRDILNQIDARYPELRPKTQEPAES